MNKRIHFSLLAFLLGFAVILDAQPPDKQPVKRKQTKEIKMENDIYLDNEKQEYSYNFTLLSGIKIMVDEGQRLTKLKKELKELRK